ncbi:uncharacterized protein LOC134252070 [Saccostrea cucullata]|uniref:uncharacterized protein LOC134252070 n=1 Tax=Saccostrea cuccullata TaxID=36930 RepID=UPI002ED13877
MSICITNLQKEDAGRFSLRIGVDDYRENVTLSVTNRSSPLVYIEKGGEGCISFPQAEIRTTDRDILREERVLCMQFSGSIEIGLMLKGAWNRSFSCQSNTSHVSVCITNASKEDEGIFTYTLLSVPIDNRTLIITSPKLIITPKSPATVKEGQSLALTCHSTDSGGIYMFFTLDNKGNRIIFGIGGGSFKACSNETQLAFIECSFGDPWLFNLTLLKPIHNQEVYCSRQVGQEGWNTSTIIQVQRLATLSVIPASDVILNQTISLECFYANGQPGAAFSYGKRFCMFEYSSCTGCQLFASLECPNNQTYRISLTVDSSWHKITMYCEPPSVQSNTIIINVTIPVSGLVLTPSQLTVNRGETITLTCQTDYCNPSAKITWFKATSDVTSQATPTEDKNQEDLVRTTSVLRFTGVIGDNGQQVYCIASNTQGRSVESNRYTIDVKYISDVKILPGSMLRVVTEQSNVWIYCYTENPEDHAKYSWTKINSNNSTVVTTGQLYVIQTATIEDGGTYTCTASNSVGNSSGSVDVTVQYTPLASVLVHVDCRSTEAYILWTSPFTNSIGNIHHTLQLSENKNLFVNASFEKMNITDDIEINTYKVTNLKPGSVYIFRVLTSNHYGIALSNNHSCVTDPERMEDTSKGCPTEQIIGGTLGGAVFTTILLIVAYALCKCRKERKNEDRNKETLGR